MLNQHWSLTPPAARPERELLNDLACYTSELAHTLGREGVPFRGPVSLAMFSGASFLGCEASTISLVRLLTGSSGASSASTAGAGGDMSDRPLFRPAVARFRDLVRAGRNPYALATEGLRLMAQGKPHAAARHVERALQLGGGDEAFPWAGQCRVVLGQARQAAGDDAGALEHFTRAAELGQRDAWQWIGRVTAGEGAREDAWFKGGVAGDPVAFGLLADEYAARSVGEDGEQARDLLAWSDEFRMMSGR